MSPRTPRPRGFARLPLAERQAIGRKGGLATQALGKAHHWNAESARVAGRKGGRKLKVLGGGADPAA